MASTGSIPDACKAGRIPDMIPTMMDAPTPMIIFVMDILMLNGITIDITFNVIATRHSPMIPPMTQSMMASIKNSINMIYLLAPNAFLIPMILVRSFTETNIIFATLNIPTTSANSPMMKPAMLITPLP